MYYGILQALARNIDQNTIIGVLHNMIKLRTESVWNFKILKIRKLNDKCVCAHSENIDRQIMTNELRKQNGLK